MRSLVVRLHGCVDRKPWVVIIGKILIFQEVWSAVHPLANSLVTATHSFINSGNKTPANISDTLPCAMLKATLFACVLLSPPPCVELHTEEAEIEFVINLLYLRELTGRKIYHLNPELELWTQDYSTMTSIHGSIHPPLCAIHLPSHLSSLSPFLPLSNAYYLETQSRRRGKMHTALYFLQLKHSILILKRQPASEILDDFHRTAGMLGEHYHHKCLIKLNKTTPNIPLTYKITYRIS